VLVEVVVKFFELVLDVLIIDVVLLVDTDVVLELLDVKSGSGEDTEELVLIGLVVDVFKFVLDEFVVDVVKALVLLAGETEFELPIVCVEKICELEDFVEPVAELVGDELVVRVELELDLELELLKVAVELDLELRLLDVALELDLELKLLEAGYEGTALVEELKLKLKLELLEAGYEGITLVEELTVVSASVDTDLVLLLVDDNNEEETILLVLVLERLAEVDIGAGPTL